MFKKNVDLILGQITKSDVVLDIGGWAQPFNRANYVIDILPYKTRGILGSLGPEKEFFSKGTWIIHDASSRKPLPFKNKEIDFVICSQTLEDIRDPIHLCSEIVRIGKKGYIEVPSRIVESTVGLKGRHCAGYYHHRWLVEIKGSEVVFRFKPHLLHSSWKFHFPKSYLKKLSEKERVSFLFWKGEFQYKEVILLSALKVAQELEGFVKRKRAYPSLFYVIDSISQPKAMVKSILKKSSKLRTIAERVLGKDIVASSLGYEPFWSDIPEIHSR